MSQSAALAVIRDELLSSKRSLSATLHRCLLLDADSDAAGLRSRAAQELAGYAEQPREICPSYRQVAAPLRIDAVSGTWHIKGQQISPMELPDCADGIIDSTILLTQGVDELEELLNAPDPIPMSIPPAMDLVPIMNYERAGTGRVIDRLYWSVPHVVVRGLLKRIRAEMLEAVGQLVEGPGAERLGAPVSVWATWRRLGTVGTFVSGLCSVAGLAFGVAVWQGWI